MKFIIKTVLVITILSSICISCSQKHEVFKTKEVYKSKDLIVTQIAENSFVHTSFKQTDDFGNVPCNGLIVRNSDEVIIFDTPTNDKNSNELIRWIKEKLACKIKALVPTHFHDDCLGGLEAFNDNGIPSYASFKTIQLANENHLVAPKNGFNESLVLKVGVENVLVKFFGEGHTKDNVVSYFPSEKILFGGCLIKAVDASKGYLGDANVLEWANTVERVKKEYPNAKIIIPGHGSFGDTQLLDYTIQLFKTK